MSDAPRLPEPDLSPPESDDDKRWACCGDTNQMIRKAKDGSHYMCLVCHQKFDTEGRQVP